VEGMEEDNKNTICRWKKIRPTWLRGKEKAGQDKRK